MVKAREIPTDHGALDLYPLAFRFDERFGRCVGVRLAEATQQDRRAYGNCFILKKRLYARR
jgi:hypothetical protein